MEKYKPIDENISSMKDLIKALNERFEAIYKEMKNSENRLLNLIQQNQRDITKIRREMVTKSYLKEQLDPIKKNIAILTKGMSLLVADITPMKKGMSLLIKDLQKRNGKKS